jgi:hypothetical protein
MTKAATEHGSITDAETLDALCQALDFNHETGEFTWRARSGDTEAIRSWNARNACRFGKKVTGLRHGYVRINFGRRYVLAHRLVWWLIHRQFPPVIDHIDGNRSNNRPGNLRVATTQLNAANRGKPNTNTSGLKGVYWSRALCKWRASIKVNSRQTHLGYYHSKEEAAIAYGAAARKYFGDFARTA